MMLSLFFGWFVSKKIKIFETDLSDGITFMILQFMIRFIIPPVLFIILVMALIE